MLEDVTLVRQPILDRNQHIQGYELLLHPLHPDNKPNMDTLKAVHATYDLPTLVGESRLFLPANQVVLDEQLVGLCPNPHKLVIEVTADVANSVEQLRMLKVLRQHGVTLALKDYQPGGAHAKVAAACQLIKIDTKSTTPDMMQQMVKTLHESSARVIADQVNNEEEFEFLRTLGFDYFQGFFFTNPIILHGKKLSANKLNLLQLMAKVNNDNTEFQDLVDIISHDVALSHKLLTAINHPQHNLPIKVTSIADAIRYMGLKRLKLWISMVLMAEVDDKPQALLVTSLVRARFCELLAEHSSHQGEKDSFFLVGLFSTLGAFFNLPQSEVLDELPIADDLKMAMVDFEGRYGRALWLAKQLENAYTDLMSLSFEGMDIMGISNDYLSATRWGQDILKQTA